MYAAAQVIHQGGVASYSPTIHKDQLYCVTNTGEIMKFHGDVCTHKQDSDLTSEFTSEVWANSTGQPLGLLFDTRSEGEHAAFVCCPAHQGILRISRGDDTDKAPVIESYVREYESSNLLGPNSIVVSKNGGMLYFTDSGPMGETSWQNDVGSVFAINTQTQLLIPLCNKRFAYPCGIALSPDENCVYVCETAKNRIVRFAQNGGAQFYSSVFHQFSGRYGPTAICVSNNGNIYVAHYEFQNQSDTGRVCVLDDEGRLTSTIPVPAPEITGLCLTSDQKYLIVTEKSSCNVYRVQLE